MNLYIVPIEPIDQRYTKQWYYNIPEIIRSTAHQRGQQIEVITVDGETVPDGTTQGAFLDFAATNVYKASQASKISQLFVNGQIKPGDKFLITDAWNFVITPLKYMSELLNIPVEIHSIWHAGAYDPTDILGMSMSKPWPWEAERSWYYSSDYNYFATEFHRQMFLKNLNIDPSQHHRAVRSGQPHDQIITQLESLAQQPKQNQVIWPHRYNADKQPQIAESLAKTFDFVITQKLKLNKSDYYATLAKSQVVFSCALHENLGISVMEGCLVGAIPVVPDRASYAEMYLPEFKYPSFWTESVESFAQYQDLLIDFISDRVNNPHKYVNALDKQQQILKQNYLNASIMVDKILGSS